MKKLLGSLIAVALLAPMAFAENPDKVPSFGFDVTQSRLGLTTGLQEFYDPADNTKTFTQGSSTLVVTQLTLDMRLPVAENLTVIVHGGPSRGQMFGATNSGYSIGGGLRVYLPKSLFQ